MTLPPPEAILTGLPVQWSAGGLLPSPRAELSRLLDVWRAACGLHSFPGRMAFGPPQLRSMLPDVHVYAVSYEPLSFTIRLVGTRMTDHIGRNLAGKPVAEVPLENLRIAMTAILTAVVSSRLPINIKATRAIALPNETHQALQSLWLPCAEDGESIDRVIAITLLGDD